MIRIDLESVQAKLETDWRTWKEKADRATETLLETWETQGRVTADDFQSALWSEFKRFLLDTVFYGKCAYCETHLRQSRQPGDADHFRPKGAVNYRELDGNVYQKPRVMDEHGQQQPHPGYFWLAYDWLNLLPACRMCNSDQGKKNQFPASGRHVLSVALTDEQVAQLQDPPRGDPRSSVRYFLRPRDLDREEGPFLLHPYFDDPGKHLRFEAKGLIFPTKDQNGEESLKGRHSIQVYDLDNEDLRPSRQDAQIAAYNRFTATMNYLVQQGVSPTEAKARAWDSVSDITSGQTEYSAAALAFLREAFPEPLRLP
jgi:hypothetical protein